MRALLAFLIMASGVMLSVVLTLTFHFSAFEAMIMGLLIGTGTGKLAVAVYY